MLFEIEKPYSCKDQEQIRSNMLIKQEYVEDLETKHT